MVARVLFLLLPEVVHKNLLGQLQNMPVYFPAFKLNGPATLFHVPQGAEALQLLHQHAGSPPSPPLHRAEKSIRIAMSLGPLSWIFPGGAMRYSCRVARLTCCMARFRSTN